MSSCWVGYSSSMELLLHFCQKSFECIWLGLLLSSVFCSIDLWVYGETMETVTDFIFLSSKITADGDYSYEIKRRLLLGRKAMTSLGSVLKGSRDPLADKGPYSQRYGFTSSHVWMWELHHKEGWALKTDAFELWCWNILLRAPWLQGDQASQ